MKIRFILLGAESKEAAIVLANGTFIRVSNGRETQRISTTHPQTAHEWRNVVGWDIVIEVTA